MAVAPVRLEDSFAYAIYRSARLLRYHFKYFTAALHIDISQEQFFLLNKLSQSSAQTQTQLGDGILADRPNMTRMITTMEANGWLRRDEDPSDGRKFRVSLTRKGELIRHRIHESIAQERARLSAGLSPADLKKLRHLLAKVEKNVMVRIGVPEDGEEAEGGEEREPPAASASRRRSPAKRPAPRRSGRRPAARRGSPG